MFQVNVLLINLLNKDDLIIKYRVIILSNITYYFKKYWHFSKFISSKFKIRTVVEV